MTEPIEESKVLANLDEQPLVSVVIPTYNRAHLLERAVHSVLNQTYSNLELLVIDDASTDNTAEVVASFDDCRVRYLRHNQNRGPSAARNTGVFQASGLYLAFLDSDDEWEPQKIELQVRALRGLDERYGMVFTGWVHDRTGDGETKWLVSHANAYGDVSGATFHTIGTNLITIMVRTELARAIGGFDESLPSAEETDFAYRLAQLCWATAVPDPLLISYRHHGQNITANSRSVMLGRLGFIAKHRAWLRQTGYLWAYQRDAAWHASRIGEGKVAIKSLLSAVRYAPTMQKTRLAAMGCFLLLEMTPLGRPLTATLRALKKGAYRTKHPRTKEGKFNGA